MLNLCQTLLNPASDDNRDAKLKDGSKIIKGLDLDKYIISNVGAFDALDLVLAVEIFADSTLMNVQEALESQLVQNMRHLHPDLASELLYKLTSRQFGTRTLITATVKRVELDSLLVQNLAPETVC